MKNVKVGFAIVLLALLAAGGVLMGPYIDPSGQPLVLAAGPYIDPYGESVLARGPYIDPVGQALVLALGPYIDPNGQALC